MRSAVWRGLAMAVFAVLRSVWTEAVWTEAMLQSEPGPMRAVRFRIPWRWQGQPAVLQSRAVMTAREMCNPRERRLANVAPGFSYTLMASKVGGSTQTDPSGMFMRSVLHEVCLFCDGC